MADYALRNLPQPLWSDVKQRARGDGLTVKAAILALCRAYVDGRIDITTSAPTVRLTTTGDAS